MGLLRKRGSGLMSLLVLKKYKSSQVTNCDYLENESLSFKAKGILTYLLSKEDGWEFSLEKLRNVSFEGETAVRSGLKELEEAGYIDRFTVRCERTKRITRWGITARDLPIKM